VSLEVIPLLGIPEVEPGDDLAELLAPPLAANAARDGDVVVVTQKIVSKAEGRIVPADERDDWIARESAAIVARRGDLVITRTRHGLVCANAGVDASNVREGFLTLLPEDADASAERLGKELATWLDVGSLGVVVSDTFGRPWREGVVDVAIGCAGLPAIVDLRGTPDAHGRALETTVVALADAVAAAAGLVMTKADRIPAALVRGLLPFASAPPGRAVDLIRRPEEDLFRESALQAVSSGSATGAFGAGPLPDGALEDAIMAAADADDRVAFVALSSPEARRRVLGTFAPEDRATLEPAQALAVPIVRSRPGRAEAALLEGGAAIGRLLVALRGRGLAGAWDVDVEADENGLRSALDLDDAWRPLGVVGVGAAAEPAS
jgi:dehydro coenzyme F420 reductase / coenzyme F420-0:L-glutamate ligase / coenzyme F420-1:gamma-L-glutamate ligase